MRQVTEQKPQRATVSSTSSSHRASIPPTRSRRPDGGDDEPRTFPAMALGLMLVVGILLGLLFAAVISSFVNGGSSHRSAGASATPTAASSAQDANRRVQQHANEIQANNAPESRDVRILGCGVDGDGYASAQVLITNSTDKRATYHVRVLFTSADGRIISDDVASAKRLAPGSTAPLV
ncbi:MAG TPA: hypothetical protein VLR26_15310, partial [Frankiaceae bacterium]|nr:hypothetical protein [Frankiaceae bacterium]